MSSTKKGCHQEVLALNQWRWSRAELCGLMASRCFCGVALQPIRRARNQRDLKTISVQLQSNSRGWLHRMFPRKRHQTRHLVNFAGLLAKQVLSQLSYTPQ